MFAEEGVEVRVLDESYLSELGVVGFRVLYIGKAGEAGVEADVDV